MKISYFNRFSTTNFTLLCWCLLAIFSSCKNRHLTETEGRNLFSSDNLVAWCIVPFDAENRGPEERAVMLKELGFEKMAWDWRMEHIETLPQEIETLQRHDIELTAIWMWIDRSAADGLLPHHERIIGAVEEANLETDFWVSFSNDYFSSLSDEDKVIEGARAVGMVHDRVRRLGCRVVLYNHMDWFGEPVNQIRIIKELGRDSIGIVYNFHHAHHQAEDFPRLLGIMMPWLYTVNLNGMKRDGPKILDIGSGDMEASMINALLNSEFDGTIGILGHTEGEDIKKVLDRNIRGLEQLLDNLEGS